MGYYSSDFIRLHDQPRETYVSNWGKIKGDFYNVLQAAGPLNGQIMENKIALYFCVAPRR